MNTLPGCPNPEARRRDVSKRTLHWRVLFAALRSDVGPPKPPEAGDYRGPADHNESPPKHIAVRSIRRVYCASR